MKILECSSKGDKRFSAFYAKVVINGKLDSIENHYQLSKRFGDAPAPKHWKEAKGRKPTHYVAFGKSYSIDSFSLWYDLLWGLYLDNNPDLIKVLLEYDGYNDCFAKPNSNNQAMSILRYLKKKGLR